MKMPENLAHLNLTEFYDKSWKGAYSGKGDRVGFLLFISTSVSLQW